MKNTVYKRLEMIDNAYRGNELKTVLYIGEFKDGWNEVGLKGNTVRVKYEDTTCVYIVKDWCTASEAEEELKLVFEDKHAGDIAARYNVGDRDDYDSNYEFIAAGEEAFEVEARCAITIQHCVDGK